MRIPDRTKVDRSWRVWVENKGTSYRGRVYVNLRYYRNFLKRISK